MTISKEQQLEHQQYWDKGADIYEEIVEQEFTNESADKWTAILSKLLKDKQGLRVLDVGAGPGFFSILLTRLGHQVTAIDSSTEMIAKARKNAEKHGCDIRIIQTDILEYEPDGVFDLIISRNVTWFLPNPVGVYRKWHQWLAEDGQTIIFDGNWNLFLTDPREAALFQAAKQEAIAAGYVPYRSEEEISEGDQIALALPLTYVKRPAWDIDMLSHIGFTHVTAWHGFDAGLYSPAEQLLNRHRPMFAIVASK
ncbi:class I SAM-dependent methyltransferase [Paenibacillus radicis (ex Gao et al. 2016)]|uniref:SAM-dependent methyltransferase n=1 Tax=Paenibacillus radicis (ex Gao et al. 2016) TaxID=1737354 RepID=A0A917H264_9BACL|nr:class I SAM-dependent methyltransferase [Paenibacillus radicis (ex Gao et al. 2016)]GGG65049.1 SAM-dependent methyltransferase [Paenibacillus radicis (ex Gao et al. 2016)]